MKQFNLEIYQNNLKKLEEIFIDLFDNDPKRITGSLLGFYSELLICILLHLNLANPNSKDYDAIDMKGKKYQVKSRMILDDGKRGKKEFGGVKPKNNCFGFDFLILVAFFDDIRKYEIYKINAANIQKIYKEPNKKSGYAFYFSKEINSNFQKGIKNKSIEIIDLKER